MVWASIAVYSCVCPVIRADTRNKDVQTDYRINRIHVRAYMGEVLFFGSLRCFPAHRGNSGLYNGFN